MVFPQGRFSIEAISALKNCGFAAAVNTTLWAVDCPKDPLSLRDFLEVAVTRYGRFPIFLRYHSWDSCGYAFYALFQKPVLVEAHHQFFQDGFGQLEALAQNVAAQPRYYGIIEWLSFVAVIRFSYRPCDSMRQSLML